MFNINSIFIKSLKPEYSDPSEQQSALSNILISLTRFIKNQARLPAVIGMTDFINIYMLKSISSSSFSSMISDKSSC